MVGPTLARAVDMAEERVAHLGLRWTHVRAVGARCARLCRDHNMPEALAVAAWLHDIGYDPALAETGFHALDGARFLRDLGADELVVSLVGYHSGAVFEAEERRLSAELATVPPPPEALLDVLTWIDMTTSPGGHIVPVDDRLSEIAQRYEMSDPVSRAIVRSAKSLREASARGAAQFGLADVGSVPLL
ncbi:HD domain-containing protein [Cellulomonas sp. NS3]|uniref:HD domain-containing protein n=1 Tax=Cellulomonas sp. NS3 TaxID=2973977 RepID=UPI0021622DD6|nr:HD domain-containing protein [Cellulomonas sp. NS3]